MPLTESFIGFYNQKYGKKFSGVAPEARKFLLDYPWPGNVRELRNMVERIILLESGNVNPHHFAALLAEREAAALSGKDSSDGRLDYEETIKRVMQEALARAGGNVLEAARLLNMPTHKMRYRIKKYGLKSG